MKQTGWEKKIIEQENQLLKIKHVTAIAQKVKREDRIEHWNQIGGTKRKPKQNLNWRNIRLNVIKTIPNSTDKKINASNKNEK